METENSNSLVEDLRSLPVQSGIDRRNNNPADEQENNPLSAEEQKLQNDASKLLEFWSTSATQVEQREKRKKSGRPKKRPGKRKKSSSPDWSPTTEGEGSRSKRNVKPQRRQKKSKGIAPGKGAHRSVDKNTDTEDEESTYSSPDWFPTTEGEGSRSKRNVKPQRRQKKSKGIARGKGPHRSIHKITDTEDEESTYSSPDWSPTAEGEGSRSKRNVKPQRRQKKSKGIAREKGAHRSIHKNTDTEDEEST